MKSEYSFVRHTSSPMTASPAIPAASSSHRAAAGTVRSAPAPPVADPPVADRPVADPPVADPPVAGLRVGQIIATAAPISRPNARVSVPSYTRVGS